ncbi:MAG: hypothetical protein JXA52_03140 [Planctomycetes bacterium]|nr:hypothetical protein [Planctomycetota bacterium]
MSEYKRTLPWTLWIALLSLFAAVVIFSVVAYTTNPVFLAGIPVPALLLWGLARGKRWAYLLTIVVSIGSMIFALYYESSTAAMFRFFTILPVLIPVLLCTWFFFPKTGLATETYPNPPNPARKKQFICCLLAVALLIGAMQTLEPTITLRDKYNLSVNPVSEGVPPEIVLATTFLGGFRSIFIDVLWLRAMAMKQEGNYFEMVQLYDWITNMQPHYAQVWSFIAWDLAYNVSVDYQDLEDRWFWIYRGIRYLRDKGIPANRNVSSLYLDLAWIFEHKLGATMDYAHQIYRVKWWRMMQEALKGSGEREQLEALVDIPDDLGGVQKYLNEIMNYPDNTDTLRQDKNVDQAATFLTDNGIDLFAEYTGLSDFPEEYPENVQQYLKTKEAIEAFKTIRLYRIKNWLANNLKENTAQQLIEIKENLARLKLEPELMLNVTKNFGPLDWRGCDAHSMYWVSKGREIRVYQLSQKQLRESLDYKMMDIRFERRLYNCMQELLRRGRFMITSDGYTYTIPDYRFIEPTLRYFRKVLKEVRSSRSQAGRELNGKGIQSCYMYLLERCIFMYYFNGQINIADRYLEYMREEAPLNPNFQVTAEQFVRNNIAQWISDMTPNRYHTMVEGMIRWSFIDLAQGDYASAANREKEIHLLEEYAQKRWPYDPENKEDQFKYLAPLEDLSSDMLVRILDGKEPGFSPAMRQRLEKALGPEKIKNARKRVEQKAGFINNLKDKPVATGQ